MECTRIFLESTHGLCSDRSCFNKQLDFFCRQGLAVLFTRRGQNPGLGAIVDESSLLWYEAIMRLLGYLAG